MIAKPRKPKPIPKLIKMTAEELAAIQANADMYADGNVSQWIRWAAIHCRPTKRQLKG